MFIAKRDRRRIDCLARGEIKARRKQGKALSRQKIRKERGIIVVKGGKSWREGAGKL